METKSQLYEHLILDSGAFIDKNIGNVAVNVYTLKEIVEESKDSRTRKYIADFMIQRDLILRQPSNESLKIVSEIAKKTGDYKSLSLVDLKVIALTHEIQVEKCGKESVNYDVKPAIQLLADKKETLTSLPPGFHNSTEDDSDFESDNDDDWIDNTNITTSFNMKESEPTTVACFSNDFSIQNMLKHMGIAFINSEGKLIKKLNTYILRCRACYDTTAIMTKEFCAKCGNKALHRVPVTVEENGTMHMQLDMERLKVTRGLKYPLKPIRGGKHELVEKVFEDQRIAQNRMARIKKEAIDSPFLLNDVTSRSALIGIRGLTRTSRRNPNEVKSRSRKGGKK